MTQPASFTDPGDSLPCIHCGHDEDDHQAKEGEEEEGEACTLCLCGGYDPDDRTPQQRKDDDWSD